MENQVGYQLKKSIHTNFADILDEWERRKSTDYIKDEENPEEDKARERRRLLRIKPEAEIDLHGLTQEEAWNALDGFFSHSNSMGFEKILIIHGKGNNSKKEGVLREVTRKFIELCPFAGKSGHNPGSSGGSGATWVLLKHK